MNYILTELKQSEPWLYNYHSKMLQMVSTQIEGSEKSLIELSKTGHKTGQLRFARYNEFRTFTYNQSGYKLEPHGDKTLLCLSKIGYVEIRKHREFPYNANIKQVIVTKSKSGKWFACITVNIEESLINTPKISFAKAVGIDVGIKSFTYDSDGYCTPNPLNLKKMLKPLARVQRKVSRRKKGSNNRLKAIQHLQRVHERIANRKKTFSTNYLHNMQKTMMSYLLKN